MGLNLAVGERLEHAFSASLMRKFPTGTLSKAAHLMYFANRACTSPSSQTIPT